MIFYNSVLMHIFLWFCVLGSCKFVSDGGPSAGGAAVCAQSHHPIHDRIGQRHRGMWYNGTQGKEIQAEIRLSVSVFVVSELTSVM